MKKSKNKKDNDKKDGKRGIATCHYCKYFYQSQVFEEGSGKNKLVFRFCPIQEKQVTVDTLACDNICVSNKFYCAKQNIWKNVEACLSNRTKGINIGSIKMTCQECVRCKQFEREIWPLVNIINNKNERTLKRRPDEEKEEEPKRTTRKSRQST